MTPFKEFLVYDSGVFKTAGREPLTGFTVVKVVGWGTDED